MIWHIFKKDLRLLWPMATMVGAVHLLNAGLLSFGGQFQRLTTVGQSQYGWISNAALPAVSLLGLVILVIAVMQQDRLPGTTQDWLTRPIPRNRLVGAKMLFILLVGLSPLLLGDLVMGTASHLHLADVIEASLTRTLALYCFICLPAMMIGAVTRSLTGALMFALAILVVLVIEFSVIASSKAQLPLTQSGFAWTAALALAIANIAAVGVLLPLQLHWRGTARVRWILAAYCCLAPVVLSLPIETVFQFQESLSHGRGGSPFTIQIDPSQRMTFSRPEAQLPVSLRGTSRFVTLSVPLVVPELPDKAPWQIDYAVIRVVGRTIDQSQGFSGVFFRPRQQPGASPSRSFGHLDINLASDLFQSAQEQHAKIEATLYSTTFRLVVKKPVRSLSGTGLDDFSVCYERSDPPHGTVQCQSTRPVGTCMHVEGAKQDNRLAQLDLFACRQTSYAPWPIPLWRDPYYQTEVNRPWEVSEAGAYIEPEKTNDSSVVSNYAPDTHLTQRIVFGIDEAVEGSSHGAYESVDGVGAAARFSTPSAIATDRHGNVYIAELDHVIRKVTPTGEVTTFAGQAGRPGADDGRGADARFQAPRGIAVDALDNVYVADTGNHLIRKISPDGMVSTIAGRSDAASAPGAWVMRRPAQIVSVTSDTFYVIDYDNSSEAVLLKVSPAGGITKLAGPDTE